MLTLHVKMKHELIPREAKPGVSTSALDSKLAERFNRPILEDNISEEGWKKFKYRWKKYRTATGLAGQSIMNQLYACMSTEVDEKLFRNNLMEESREDDLFNKLEPLIVEKKSILVKRVQFRDLSQRVGEPIMDFVGRLKSAAALCNFRVKDVCNCQEEVEISYEESEIKYQLLKGIADKDFQEKIFLHGDHVTLTKTIELLDALEKAKKGREELSGEAKINEIKSNPNQPKKPSNKSATGDSCRACGSNSH